MEISEIYTVEELKEKNRKAGGHFFDHNVMVSFGSTIHGYIFHVEKNGETFLCFRSSENDQSKPNGKSFSLNVMDETGRIRGELRKVYNTMEELEKAAVKYHETQTLPLSIL